MFRQTGTDWHERSVQRRDSFTDMQADTGQVNIVRHRTRGMGMYDVLVRIDEDAKDDAMASILTMHADAKPVRLMDGSNLYKLKVRAYTTVNAIEAGLSGIEGVGVVNIVPKKTTHVVLLRRHGFWLLVAVAWAALYAVSVAVPDNPIEDMSKSQEILVHSAVAIALAVAAYRSGQKSRRHIERSTSSSELGAWGARNHAQRAVRRH